MLLALLLLAPATSSSPSFNRCQPRFEKAAAQLRVADGATKRGDYRAANVALDAGLERLGYDYAPPEVADDTDLHLILAKGQQRNGKLRLAAASKRSILASRLRLCSLPAQRTPRR